ncbi:MAG TPA: tyrosine-type recombinase/integrase [Roseiflexaceae bacterium]|jgi:integrase
MRPCPLTTAEHSIGGIFDAETHPIPSSENQIVHLLTHLCRIGQSRHAAKHRPGLTPGTCEADWHIYSEDTRDRYTEAWLALLHALESADRPKLLRDVTPEVFLKGFQALKDKGNSDASLKTQLCAWRKLARGRILAGWSDMPAEVLVPDALYADLEGSKPQGPISDSQAAMWRALVVEAVARSRTYGADLLRMFDLLLHAGLRLEECARLRERMLDRQRHMIALTSSITKGGRPRTVALETSEARAALDAIPVADDWLWLHGPKLARRLRAILHAAAREAGITGRKGPHRLRALCAQRALDRQRAAIDVGLLSPDGADAETLREYRARCKIAERSARQAVSRMLGHNRLNVVTNHYAQ